MIYLGKTTLKIWMIGSSIQEESAFISKQLKQIQEKFQFEAELRLMTWNRAFDTIIDAFKNNSAPDIFATGTTWVHTLCYMNYLAPVPLSFPMRPLLASWLEDTIRVKGVIYTIPFLSEAYVLMAKQNILDSVGIKAEEIKHWDSFYTSCIRIIQYFKEHGREHIPLAFPLRPEVGTLHRYVVWLYKAGWEFPKLRSGMNRIFRNDCSIQVMKYMSRFLRASGAELNTLQTDTQFLLNHFNRTEDDFTFFVGNGNTYVANLMNNRSDKNIRLYPLPSLGPDGRTFGGGSVMAVSSTCKEKELAWKVVEHLTSQEVLLGLSAINGNIPPYVGSFWDIYGYDPCIKVLKEEFSRSTSYDNHPLWHVVEQASGDYIARYFWKSIIDEELKNDVAPDHILEGLDNGIIDILNMTWEMQEDDTGGKVQNT